MSAAHLIIGLDAGGSTTRLHAHHHPSGATWETAGPGANPAREGIDGAAETLSGLLQEALTAHPGAELRAVCAGVAGAGETGDQQALADAIRERLGEAAPPLLRIVHDAVIAVEGAFDGGSGMIVIVGTGSSLMARSEDGDLIRAGGWGYLVGDEGSGHALGVQGLNAVAAAFDGGPTTALTTLLAEGAGIDSPDALKQRVYHEHWPVQEAAPLVLAAAENDDPVALEIIRYQTGALARQAGWLARRAGSITPRVAMLGGLSASPSYQRALAAALLYELPGWRVQEPRHPAVVGAYRLALGE